eukprot:8089488-Pyramimonas_sp.AAC.1
MIPPLPKGLLSPLPIHLARSQGFEAEATSADAEKFLSQNGYGVQPLLLSMFLRSSSSSHCSLPRLCLEGFLLRQLKVARQCKSPWAVPPGAPRSAPRLPQLRRLGYASRASLA